MVYLLQGLDYKRALIQQVQSQSNYNQITVIRVTIGRNTEDLFIFTLRNVSDQGQDVLSGLTVRQCSFRGREREEEKEGRANVREHNADSHVPTHLPLTLCLCGQ